MIIQVTPQGSIFHKYFTWHIDMFVEICIDQIRFTLEHECPWHDSICPISLWVHSIGHILSKGRYNRLHYPQDFECCIFELAWFLWNHLVLCQTLFWTILYRPRSNILLCLECFPRRIRFVASGYLDKDQDKSYFSFVI